MKKQTKAVILSIALCMIFALGVFCVFAVKNLSLVSGGSIKFIAPGINATISNATLTGISKESGSGQMSEFTITQSMTAEQIESLDGYKSWSGLKLLFDDDSDGKAKLSFDITNNSSKAIENIMVELSTNTSHSSPVVVTPSADFCIVPGQSHTFNLVLLVQNVDQSAIIDDFELVVELGIIKPNQVLSVEEHQQTTGLNFTTNSSAKTAVFSSYTTPTGATALADGLEVEIPAVIKDANGNLYTVTEIKDGGDETSGAFYSVKTTLTKITLPNTLTKIGSYAFYECTALSGELLIPNSVTSIGQRTFYNCSGLTSVIISSGVTSIEAFAFYNCSGLTGDLKIPNSVTSVIYQYAFYNCSGLTSVIIPSGVTSIGASVFENCSGLTSVIILSGVTSIANSAFENCRGLTSLTIPSGVTSIGAYAFSGCSGLTGELIMPNSVTSIGERAFWKCSGLTSVVIPSSVTSIGNYAFNSCSKLTSITVSATTPPTLGGTICFNNTNNCNIYVPAGSVDAYKTATNWSEYASRIFAIA